jgi:hypothetical protein
MTPEAVKHAAATFVARRRREDNRVDRRALRPR